MKAQLLVLVLTAMVIGMTGCGGQEAPVLPAAPIPGASAN